MIITKTPFRMSFFGGGTDLPQYFESGRGAVISTTFDKSSESIALSPMISFVTLFINSNI